MFGFCLGSNQDYLKVTLHMRSDEIFSCVLRDKEGNLISASVYWACPPCLSYFSSEKRRWFRKGLDDQDYVEIQSGEEHEVACFEQIIKELKPEEKMKFGLRQNLDNI